MIINQIHYFGCGATSGHYLFPRSQYDVERKLNRFDASLCPPRADGLYRIAVNRLGGLDVLALAWWDQSVDKRENSNSIVFYPGADSPKEEALKEFVRVFPWAFKRIPQPLTWQRGSK